MKNIYKFLIITNPVFLVIFTISYFLSVLFLNSVFFGPVAANEENLIAFGGMENMEPIYHFLLRHFNLIEGGRFVNYDTDLSRIAIIQLLNVFVYIYILEWFIYRVYAKIRHGRYV